MIPSELGLYIFTDFPDGVQFRKIDILGNRQTVCFCNLAEGLHLLDRVNAQVCLQVQIRLQHLLGVTGLFGDHGCDLVRDIGAAAGT